MKLPIWSHQVRTSYVQSVLGPDDAAIPCLSEIWEKTHDGTTWMAVFDNHPLEIRNLEDVLKRQKDHAAAGRGWLPWMVPHGRRSQTDLTNEQARAEGTLYAETARAALANAVILDVEPHYHGGATPQFWRDDFGANETTVRVLLDAFRAVWPGDIWLSCDARDPHLNPIAFGAWWAHDAVTRVLPQTYWTDFQRPWRESIDRANALLHARGVPPDAISHVLPGNAATADLVSAISYLGDGGYARPSLWQRLNTTRRNVAAIAAMSDPWELAPEPPPEIAPGLITTARELVLLGKNPETGRFRYRETTEYEVQLP